MDYKAIKLQVQHKQNLIHLKEDEIALLYHEIYELKSKLWIEISWDNLHEIVVNHYKHNDSKKIYVMNSDGLTGMCQIVEHDGKEEQLQIDGFWHNDRFPRGENLLIYYSYLSPNLIK